MTAEHVHLLRQVPPPLLHDAWVPPLLHFAPRLRSIVLLPQPRLAEECADAGEPHAVPSPLENAAQPAQLVRPSEGTQGQAACGHHVHDSGHLSTTTGRGDQMRVMALLCSAMNSSFNVDRETPLMLEQMLTKASFLGLGKPNIFVVVLNLK